MSGELSDAQLRQIFEREIRPELDSFGASSRSEPTLSLVIVGGQPGAGKSQAVARAAEQHPGIVEVIGDDLRVYHPDYERLMREAPLEMPGATAQASGRWVGMSIDYLREQRKSTLLETTLRQLPVVQDTAARFQEAGYRIELHVVAVPLEVSRLGTVSRYLGQVQQQGTGRWTPAAAHDDAAAAVPSTAAELVRTGRIDQISIENRQGVPYFQTAPLPEQRRVTAAAVIAAIDEARHPTSLERAEAVQWLDTAIRDVQACTVTNQSDPDLLATLGRVVHEDAPVIAAVAYPDDARTQRIVLNQLVEAQRPPDANGAQQGLSARSFRDETRARVLEANSEQVERLRSSFPTAPGAGSVQSPKDRRHLPRRPGKDRGVDR